MLVEALFWEKKHPPNHFIHTYGINPCHLHLLILLVNSLGPSSFWHNTALNYSFILT